MLLHDSSRFNSVHVSSWVTCSLVCRVVGNTQVISQCSDHWRLIRLIDHLLAVNFVLHIPMIHAQPGYLIRQAGLIEGCFERKSFKNTPLLWKTFLVQKARPRKCKLLNDWKVWYQCEAKNATRLHTILACKTNLTKAVHFLQAKQTKCFIPNQHNWSMIICN